MTIFYAPNIEPPTHVLDEDESRHATRVLRLAMGGRVHLVDGRGGLYEARIVGTGRRCELAVEGVEQGWGRRNYGLTMAVAPTKNIERFEWFLEKATEVGIDAIVPLLTEHSERRMVNHDRLERIMVGAMKQSLKAYLPDLQPLTPFKEILKRPFDGAKLIAHCGDGEKKYIADAAARGGSTLILIGPEGDFSPAEIALAKAAGFTEISLGSARLRTETAALCAVIEVAVTCRQLIMDNG